MPHNFTGLFSQYPAVIAQMPRVFSSHEFILRLARDNQTLYVLALGAYANTGAPFRRVHATLSKQLHSSSLVRHLGKVMTPNIFGDNAECGQWERV